MKWIIIWMLAAGSQNQTFPWRPEVKCALNPAKPAGLHPDALAALRKLALGHRITQGLNNSSDRGNVHYTDGAIGGNAYTGAVDISVRCLTESQIKMLLARLAEHGFAGWYRKQGQDDWVGPPHIHAVWAGCPLKPFLRWQVESWLSGTNGLPSNRHYGFWQASASMKDTVKALYEKFN